MSALLSCMVPFFLMLLTSSCAWGQANHYARNPTTKITTGITRDAGLDVLPRETFVPFTRQGNLMLVDGSINGKSITMIFDTGAAGCLFSRATLKSLNITMPANLQAATVAGVGTNRQTEAWIMPVTLKLGSIERRQFPVHINDNSLGFPLLGVNFLQGFEYTINTDANIIQFKFISKDKASVNSSPQSSLTANNSKNNTASGNAANLTAASLPTPANFSYSSMQDIAANLTSKPYITVDTSCHYVYTVPFAEYNGAIIVLVNIGGQKCPMILDTGTNICLFSNAHIEQLKSLGIAPHFTGRMLIAKGVAGNMKAPLYIFDEAQFGPIKDHLVCLVSDQAFLPRPLLGQNFFSKWQLTVDHAHGVIKFIRR